MYILSSTVVLAKKDISIKLPRNCYAINVYIIHIRCIVQIRITLLRNHYAINVYIIHITHNIAAYSISIQIFLSQLLHVW